MRGRGGVNLRVARVRSEEREKREFLIDSRTIFIPKKEDVSSPTDLRPISIASVVLRHHNKILAKRLSLALEDCLDEFQFGFRPFDGIAKGLTTLDSILKNSKMNLEGLSLASIDLRKAFDSISHQAIRVTLEKFILPKGFNNYVSFLYEKAKTKLHFGGEVSAAIHPAKGVRQGDPVSPFLFIMVFDNVLRKIPRSEGVMCEGKMTNHITYADDLILMTNEKKGLQHIFDEIVPTLSATGLEINVEKSFALHWIKDGKRKRLLFDRNLAVIIINRPIRTIEVDEFKYLGVKFSPSSKLSIVRNWMC